MVSVGAVHSGPSYAGAPSRVRVSSQCRLNTTSMPAHTRLVQLQGPNLIVRPATMTSLRNLMAARPDLGSEGGLDLPMRWRPCKAGMSILSIGDRYAIHISCKQSTCAASSSMTGKTPKLRAERG